MTKKILLLAAGLMLALVGTTSVAGAQDSGAGDYPPAGNSITSTDTTVAPGGAMVLGIQVCRAGSAATFELDGEALASATANSDGVASTQATIPSGTSAGSHTITGECPGANGQPLTLVLGITVTAPGGATAPMPRTGSSSTIPMTQVALAALAGGGLLVLMANKRRGAKADSRETAGV